MCGTDYQNVRDALDAMQDRLRSAITEAIMEHGMESREHRRLRWALSGERPVEDEFDPTA
jgi:predicted metal-dependent hydrolase